MTIETLRTTEEDGSLAVAEPVLLGPWSLMWRKFRRHRIAHFSFYVVLLIYVMALLGEFFAPCQMDETSTRMAFAPPQVVHLFVDGPDGRTFQPHATRAENSARQGRPAPHLCRRPDQDLRRWAFS